MINLLDNTPGINFAVIALCAMDVPSCAFQVRSLHQIKPALCFYRAIWHDNRVRPRVPVGSTFARLGSLRAQNRTHKAMRTLLATISFFTTFAAAAQADMARYELDPEHTSIYFTVDHIGFAKTLGIFTDVNGSFMYDVDTQELGDVAVSISTGSVNTFNEARDGHVRKADFLHVSEHPEITFVASGGSPASGVTGTVTGDLTVLGVTQPVTLDVTLNKVADYPFGHQREVLGLSMTATIQRSDFGMTYAVENGLVGDDVSINIETEAMKME